MSNIKIPSKLPLYHPSRLIEARVPIGFAMHMGANFLLLNYPLTLQIPLVLLVWWELAKEFPVHGRSLQIVMTSVQLIELYIMQFHSWMFAVIGLSPLQLSLIQVVGFYAVCHVLGVKSIDNVILNYLFFGVTVGNLLIVLWDIDVMFTISMAIAGSDCIQYFVGKKFGKTKIVPKISPNKSLEGYIGAIVGCNIIHIFLLDHWPTATNLVYVNGLLFVGIVGDLFISWWKRKHQLKDTSHLLTGHGGFLDRLDSHLSAWIWSYFFAILIGQVGTAASKGPNFTEMDHMKIWYLIGISWACVWLRFFYVAIRRGELV